MPDRASQPYPGASSSSANAFQYLSATAQRLIARGERSKAAAMLREAYRREPGTARGNFSLGRACFLEGDHSEAERVLREAIALNPSFADSYRLLGQLLQERGHFEGAEGLILKAIELEPHRIQGFKALTDGRRMAENDRPLIERVRAVLNEGRLAPPDQCALYYAMGKAYDDLGEYEIAIKEYDHANQIAAQMFLNGRPFQPERLIAIRTAAERSFTRPFFQHNRRLGSESEMPILILGMMRSGTTLAERIVSSHPSVGAAGELPFWTQEGQKILRLDGAIDEARLSQVQQGYIAKLQSVAAGRDRITDKRPGNRYLIGHIHVAFPRAKIIHCRRNPTDTALSIYMTPSSAPVEYGYIRENIVFAYREYEKLMDHYRSVLPDGTMLDIQYEDLIADHEKVARQMIEFLGLDWNETCLHPENNPQMISTPSLWQARQPIYRSSVDRWKNYEPWLGAFRQLLQ